MQRSSSVRGAAILAVVAVMGHVGATSAGASEEASAETVANLVSAVAPDQGEVVEGDLRAGEVLSETEGVVSRIPLDPDSSVNLESELTPGAVLEIALPEEVSVADGEVAADGTVVYRSTDGGASAAVQALEDGSLRIQTIIPDATAPHSFTYVTDDDLTPVETPEGGIALVSEETDGAMSVAVLDEPWAQDASGAPVATHYEIKDGAVVQVVEASSSTSYPVVADPKWKWYAGAWSAKFNRNETIRMAFAGGVGAMCAYVKKIAPTLSTICGFYGVYITTQALLANQNHMCIAITSTPPPLVLVYDDNDCT